VLEADVFVYHAGETSFGSEANTRRTLGAQTVLRMYPKYGPMVAEFQRRDTAKRYRIAVSAWRMKHSGCPVILSISHDLGGGVAQYEAELRQILAAERVQMLALTPTTSGAVMLRNLDPEDDFSVGIRQSKRLPGAPRSAPKVRRFAASRAESDGSYARHCTLPTRPECAARLLGSRLFCHLSAGDFERCRWPLLRRTRRVGMQ
jgi:hypothetical protein